jgi:hypothetical protein
MPEKDGPLAILGKKLLLLCPPCISDIIGQLEGVEDYPYFVKLVKEFLPEREKDILGARTPALQLATFATYFEDRYFPLHPSLKDGMAEGYADLTNSIPVIMQSIGYEDYHELPENARPGLLLLTYLLEVPYLEDDATRISLGEGCAELVPHALLEKIPEKGFTDNQCQELLNGTRFEALAHLSLILQRGTNNFFLDIDYDDLYSGMQPPDWDREDVEELTKQWRQADNMWINIGKLADWIEKDPTINFEDILYFMLQKPGGDKIYGNKDQLKLPLVITEGN